MRIKLFLLLLSSAWVTVYLFNINSFHFQLILRKVYSGTLFNDHCTMCSDRNVIDHRNVREEPHPAYRADRDVLVFEVTARVVAAAFHVLAMKSKQDKPKHFTIPDNPASQSSFKHLQFLHKTAAKIEVVVDETMMNGSLQKMVSVQERQTILNH